ncbi:MAG TPA: helix-turn-helix transcriptional regulator [Nocardioidaceae bacterium]|nr:helix-turn-helix transcriptional regulator [Nocardioidaceae bacterium]
MTTRSDVLRQVMTETGTTQTLLSRLSGVHQPSISGFLSDRVDMSDEMLDRLLSCMGYQLEVVRRPIRPTLTRSVERSWRLHRQLSTHLSPETLKQWRPTILSNIKLLQNRVQGEPHTRNLSRWRKLVRDGDVSGLRRVMTGLDTDSIEMREVGPFTGLLPNDERLEVLHALRRAG